MTNLYKNLTQLSYMRGSQNYSERTRFDVNYNSWRKKLSKPHQPFRNWIKLYKTPWICFCDVSIFCLYLLFALYHQKGAISFTLDFSDTMKAYFLKDIDFPSSPLGISVGVGQIYFYEDLQSIFNASFERLFAFPDSFPCAYPFLINGDLTLDLLLDANHTKYSFTSDQLDLAYKILEDNTPDFESISLSLTYHILVTNVYHDTRLSVDCLIEFKHDFDTDTIFMYLSHTRFQEKYDFTDAGSILTSLSHSIPISISLLNLISIVLIITETYKLYRYCYEKTISSGRDPLDKFRSKFDYWNIYALITNLVSIVSSIFYLFYGQNVEVDVPPILYLLSSASFMHSLLLIRYLRLNPSTMLIIRVFYKSAVKIVLFLIGCFPVFLGALCFGNCIFGPYTENFATGMQGSAFLFCVMHGDSIKDFYDCQVQQYDVNYYVGFISASFWVLFSLLIMFNITISIVQETMSVEERNLRMKKK